MKVPSLYNISNIEVRLVQCNTNYIKKPLAAQITGDEQDDGQNVRLTYHKLLDLEYIY